MQQVAVVTDSISCIPPELAERYHIIVMPINLYVNGTLYRDGIDMTTSQAYEMFLSDPESFKSSAPSPETCLDAFRAAAGFARNILCVTVSQKLSVVFNSAMEAKELAGEALPGRQIEIMDSMSATSSQGMVALEAAKAADSGNNLDEVLAVAGAVKEKVEAVLLLETIRHVYRSGRIPRIASQVGSMLNVKPLLTIHEAVHFCGAVRSREHGLERLLEKMRSRLADNPAHVAVMHAYAREEADKLMETVAREFNCTELWLAEFSPVMGYACGTGTLGVAYFPE